MVGLMNATGDVKYKVIPEVLRIKAKRLIKYSQS